MMTVSAKTHSAARAGEFLPTALTPDVSFQGVTGVHHSSSLQENQKTVQQNQVHV